MMLGNIQQGEGLLHDTLKEEKTGNRQVVEVKKKGEHQESAAACIGFSGGTG